MERNPELRVVNKPARIVTKSGVVVGGAYMPPSAEKSTGTDVFQGVPLHRLPKTGPDCETFVRTRLENFKAERQHKAAVRRWAHAAERLLPWIAGACIAMSVKGWLS